MKYWLVRKPDMRFSRPIPEPEMVKKIETGEVSSLDEICESGGYWFGLSDVQEVRAHFGDIPLNKIFPRGTQDMTDTTDTHQLNATRLIETTRTRDILTDPLIAAHAGASVQSPNPSAERDSASTDSDLQKIRIRNAAWVLALFVIFASVLAWIWAGSY